MVETELIYKKFKSLCACAERNNFERICLQWSYATREQNPQDIVNLSHGEGKK